MYLLCEISDLILLLCIERPLVHAVRFHGISQLASGKVMENPAFLTCIDHFSIIESLKLLRKLRFIGKLLQSLQYRSVHALGGEVVGKSFRHGGAVLLYTFRAAFPAHRFLEIHFLQVEKPLVGSKGVKVVPGDHNPIPP